MDVASESDAERAAEESDAERAADEEAKRPAKKLCTRPDTLSDEAAAGKEHDMRDVDEFFKHSTAPANLPQDKAKMIAWVAEQRKQQRVIVLMTSGGTRVPLEQNMVRFLDNFSTGARGAACSELFLKHGCAVLLLRRQGSVAPFARHFQQAFGKQWDLSLLEHLRLDSQGQLLLGSAPAAMALQTALKDNKMIQTALKDNKMIQDSGSLLHLEFNNVGEYMHLLKAACEALAPCKKQAMLVSAAAVSDFFIPEPEMEAHKIQSRDGPLRLELAQTPKLLPVIRYKWAPDMYCVSFKLETKESLLIPKSRAAIQKYGMHCVVANELHSRYDKLMLVAAKEVVRIARQSGDAEIEVQICDSLLELHRHYMQQNVLELHKQDMQEKEGSLAILWRFPRASHICSLGAVKTSHVRSLSALKASQNLPCRFQSIRTVQLDTFNSPQHVLLESSRDNFCFQWHLCVTEQAFVFFTSCPFSCYDS
eukprot:g52702.t1